MASLKNRTRPTRRATVTAALFAILLVASGCAQSSDPDTWEEADADGKIEENFARACTEGNQGAADAGALADYCECSYDDLRQEYDDDFQGFRDVNDALGSDPTAVPPNVAAIFEACATAHLS